MFDAYVFFSSRRRHTRYWRDWSSDVCSSDLALGGDQLGEVDGTPVPAEMARQLARAFAGLDPVADPAGADATAADNTIEGTATDGTTATAASGDTDAADVEPDATSPVGGAVEPVDVEGDPIEQAARELNGADFDRWLDELVRLGFGDDPAP